MLGGVDASCLFLKISKYGDACIARTIWIMLWIYGVKDDELYVTVIRCGEDWRGSKLIGFHHTEIKFAFYEPDSSV